MAEKFDMNSMANAKSQSQGNAKKTWRDDFNKKYNAAKTDAERYKVVNEYQKMMAKGGAIANDSYMKNALDSKVIDMQKSGYLGKDGKPYSQQELNAALADQSWGSPDVKENLAYYGVLGKENTQQAKDSEKALKAVADDIKTGNVAGENFKEYTKTDSGKRYTGMTNEAPKAGEASGATEPQISGTNGNPSETATTEERQGNMNGLLLADMLMTGVRNALHYRPSFRTAYGTSYDGQGFGNEKSLAGRMAEENMKRGLERMNARQDYRAQQEEQIAATKAKGGDAKYLAAEQALTQNVSPTQKQWSNSSSNALGSQANSGATTEYPDSAKLAQKVQASR